MHLSSQQGKLLKLIQAHPYSSSSELAAMLGCGKRTMETHLSALHKKFEVSSRSELLSKVAANEPIQAAEPKPKISTSKNYKIGDRVLLVDPKRLGYYSPNPIFTIVELRGENNIKIAGKWLHHWISPSSISGKIAEDGTLPKTRERKRIHVYGGRDCA